MKISRSVFGARKKNFFRILIAIFVLTSLFIIVCTISNLFYKKSNLIIDSYSTKLISESELEEIVKIKFSEVVKIIIGEKNIGWLIDDFLYTFDEDNKISMSKLN